jgi:hypothetical protein
MWPWRLISLLLPDFFGNPAHGTFWGYATYWEDTGYIGVLPFFLASLAVLAWARRRLRREPPERGARRAVPLFALLALLSLLMALGKNTPFYLFFYRRVPGFAQFQAPARWLSIYTASAAVLAGIGLDTLVASRAITYWSRLGIAGCVQAGLLAWLATTERAQAAVAAAGFPEVQPTMATAILRFSLLTVLSLLLLLWQQRQYRAVPSSASARRAALVARAWPAAVLLLVSGDLIYAGWGLNPAIDASYYASPTEAAVTLSADGPQGRLYYSEQARQDVLFGTYLAFADFRSDLRGAEQRAYWQGLREALVPDLAMAEGLSSANTYEPLVEGRYRTLLLALEDADPQIAQRTLGRMNVAYLFDPEPPDTAEVVHRSPAVSIYRNPDLRPRAYVAYRAIRAESPDHALALFLSPSFDPATVILETPLGDSRVSQSPAFSVPESAGTVDILPSPPNQAKIRVTLTQPGYLVLMDTAYPGWRATVDGQDAVLERANYAFRALALEAGAHDIVLVYWPRSLTAGLVVSGAALIALLVALVVLGWEKERH